MKHEQSPILHSFLQRALPVCILALSGCASALDSSADFDDYAVPEDTTGDLEIGSVGQAVSSCDSTRQSCLMSCPGDENFCQCEATYDRCMGAVSAPPPPPPVERSVSVCGTTFSETTLATDTPFADITTREKRITQLANADSGFASSAASDFGLGAVSGSVSDYLSSRARMTNMLWVLKNAAWGDGGYVLNVAYSMAAARTDVLHPDCLPGNRLGENRPKKSWPSGRTEDRIYFSPKALYLHSVIERAAIMVHEARHSDSHYVNSGNILAALDALPLVNIHNSVVDDHQHNGWGKTDPYAMQAMWLAWFAVNANPAIFDDADREHAAQLANDVINRWFADQGLPAVVARPESSSLVIANLWQATWALPQLVVPTPPRLVLTSGYCTGSMCEAPSRACSDLGGSFDLNAGRYTCYQK